MRKPLRLQSIAPAAVRVALAETVEDIGQALGLLRESVGAAERGRIQEAKLCGSDAVEILSSLETRFSQMAASLARWSEN